MKKLTLLLLVFVVYSSLLAQTGSETATDSKKDSSKKEPDKIIVFDLKKWEATKSQPTTFKAGEKFSVQR